MTTLIVERVESGTFKLLISVIRISIDANFPIVKNPYHRPLALSVRSA